MYGCALARDIWTCEPLTIRTVSSIYIHDRVDRGLGQAEGFESLSWEVIARVPSINIGGVKNCTHFPARGELLELLQSGFLQIRAV